MYMLSVYKLWRHCYAGITCSLYKPQATVREQTLRHPTVAYYEYYIYTKWLLVSLFVWPNYSLQNGQHFPENVYSSFKKCGFK